jgi:hypothetical protein
MIPGHEPGDGNRGPVDKGRAIDPMSGKCVRLKEPDPVSSPMDKRTGASPSCLRVSQDACL